MPYLVRSDAGRRESRHPTFAEALLYATRGPHKQPIEILNLDRQDAESNGLTDDEYEQMQMEGL